MHEGHQGPTRKDRRESTAAVTGEPIVSAESPIFFAHEGVEPPLGVGPDAVDDEARLGAREAH
jgi:hypothetical protein